MHIGTETILITSSSGIYKANIYHNDCYTRLFVFKFHLIDLSFLEIIASLF